jgi:hypothetical protein
MAKRCLVKDMGIRFSHLLPNIFLPTLGAEPLNSPLICFMKPVSSYHTEIQAGMAKAREVPHTDWVMNLYGWTGILLLILCLVPAVWLAWKSENFRVLWRSIRWGRHQLPCLQPRYPLAMREGPLKPVGHISRVFLRWHLRAVGRDCSASSKTDNEEWQKDVW